MTESAALLQAVLNNEPGPARDIVSLNAGAAIYVAGLANNLADGIHLAQTTLSQRTALDKLTAWIEFTHRL